MDTRTSSMYTELSQFLTEMREEVGLTQVELSQRLGQDIRYIAKIEKNPKGLGIFECADIVRALGGDPAEAIGAFELGLKVRGLL